MGVPVVAGGLGVAVLGDDVLDGVGDDARQALVHVLAVQDGVALVVDGGALQVHDVVVLEHVLSCGEVHGLHLALGALDGLGHHARLDGHVLGHVGLLHHGGDGVHAVAAEQAHEVVFQREVELRGAGVSLTARTAAQLVVDAARLVALGADDAQAAGIQHLVVLPGAHGPGLLQGRCAVLVAGGGHAPLLHLVALVQRRVEAAGAQDVVGEHVGVAAQQDVGAAAGHVGGDGDGPHASGLGDDVGLALVVLGVQGLVPDAALVKQARELLGAFDGHGADEAGLAVCVARRHVVGHGVELRLDGAVDKVVLVVADDRLVRRDGHHGQVVDLAELLVLGHGGAGHAGEFVVEAEVVLQRDGGKGLVLLAHLHALLGLHGLVQALRPAPSLHDAPGELVHDLHLAVGHHVVDVAVEQELGFQRLLQVVGQLPGRVGVDVVDAQHRLHLLKAALGGGDGLLRLVHLEVLVADEAGHHAGELVVGLGGLGTGAGDDQRRARLVDEDGVDLVHDGEVVPPLHAAVGAGDHVVAQVVEAELGVGAVGDVGGVGKLFLGGLHAVLDKAHLHAQGLVHLPHPLAVAPCQVVVDGDHVNALVGDGVEVAGKRRDERFALAGLHLGDLALVQHHAADELHGEMAKADGAHGRLAGGGEGLGQKVVQVLAPVEPLAKRCGDREELLVGELLHAGLQRVDVGGAVLVLAHLLAFA